MNIILPPHKLKSEPVNYCDLDIVRRDAPGMIALCHQPLGKKTGALAIAHCQVEANKPLRFYVTINGDIFINPRIVQRYDKPVRRKEGCMSYPNFNEITIPRNEKIRMINFTLKMEPCSIILDGIDARIAQHEIDHFEGKTIYG